MFSLASFQRSHGRTVRSIVCLSLMQTAPVLQASDGLADVDAAHRGGPGWYDSSWDLICGLDTAEIADLEAELDMWIEACLTLGPATAVA